MVRLGGSNSPAARVIGTMVRRGLRWQPQGGGGYFSMALSMYALAVSSVFFISDLE